MIKTGTKLALISILIAVGIPAMALDLPMQIQPVNPVDMLDLTPKNLIGIPPKRATLSKNDVKNQYAIALDRFIQSNVKSSYADFRVLIETTPKNDYAYMQMAERMADLGFFNLSELAMSKMQDKEVTDIIVEDVKRYYFPSKKLRSDDEIYLGEMYSNIVYNAQSREASTELIKNTTLLKNSDYANYVVALGLLKSGDIENAKTYIDIAVSMNDKNLNYKKLQAEIISQGKKPQDALKIVAYIKQQPLYSTEFTRKVNSLEQFILYKTKKNEAQKNYHLGFYSVVGLFSVC